MAVMDISLLKTEVFAIYDGQISVELGDKALKSVMHFKYLGCVITADSDSLKTVSADFQLKKSCVS